MYCSSCGHENHDSKFCVKCGTQLLTVETQSQPEMKPGKPLAENERVKKAMDTSQQFFRFFLDVVKSPARAGESAGEGAFLNGIIAQALYAFVIPLIILVLLISLPFGGPSFIQAFLKPFIYLLIMLAFVNAAIFVSGKLGKTSESPKDIVGRFGTFLIIPLALELVALVLAVIQLWDIALYVLYFGMLGMLVAIVLTIFTFKKQSEQPDQGLDPFYSIMVGFVIVMIAFYIFVRSVASSLVFSFF